MHATREVAIELFRRNTLRADELSPRFDRRGRALPARHEVGTFAGTMRVRVEHLPGERTARVQISVGRVLRQLLSNLAPPCADAGAAIAAHRNTHRTFD